MSESKQPNRPDPSEGGKARAKKLSAAEREEIARKGADARWNIPHATHTGTLNITGITIGCVVLNDGRRVLDQRAMMAAIGRTGKPNRAETSGGESSYTLPTFLDADNLKPFIGCDLQGPSTVVVYRALSGQRAFGYEARLLPLACDIYLTARRAGVLTHRQVHVAEACELLVGALAQTGIVGLVDEATGYQEVRDRHALQAILDRYFREAFAAWAKRFPDEFYKEMFRLRGWTWKGMNVNRPQCVAAYTKDLVYNRLEVGVLEELERRNPIQQTGRRRSAHHQWFTDEVGHPALAQHLHAVIGLMRAAPDKDWSLFMRLIDRAFPKRGHSIQLDFFDTCWPLDPESPPTP